MCERRRAVVIVVVVVASWLHRRVRVLHSFLLFKLCLLVVTELRFRAIAYLTLPYYSTKTIMMRE